MSVASASWVRRIGWVSLALTSITCRDQPRDVALADAGSDDAVADIRSSDLSGFETASGCATESCCGNGVLDLGEECDDGNGDPGDGCSPLCQLECPWAVGCSPGDLRGELCGDDRLGPGEVCDDGNTSSGDGCGADCLTIEPGWTCPVPGRPCVPICGDHVVTGPETCDDGNVIAGDGCSDHCTVEAPCFDAQGKPVACPSLCGDGTVEGDEACDDGPRNDDGAYDGCTTDCRFGPYCGDGVTTPGHEACDLGPGNNALVYDANPAPGCTPWCERPHFCGDGYVDAAFGEQCDFGARNGQAEVLGGRTCVCDTSCQLAPECQQ